MYRKWKSMFALGMAVLIGCSMPMGTMLAAEENPEAVQEVEADSASDTDAAYVDETVLDDNGNGGDEINAEDENAADEVDVDDAIADEEVIADDDGNAGIAVMSVEDAEAGDQEVQVHTAAPVIDIKWSGESWKAAGLGGSIDYKYINPHGQAIQCSANYDGQNVSLAYYLDKISTTNAEAKGEADMASLAWENVAETQTSQADIKFSNDGKYVLYVKAEADGQTTYARSCGIVVDTIAPEVTNLVDGGTYPEGTTFQVRDDYLESVKVNEVDVTGGWNAAYQVSANGTSCVIKLRDKAGNEKVYNINVSRGPSEDGVISANGIYSLKAGTSYKLGEGQWQVGGDKSVYAGGNTFYVKADGNYSFTKR